MRFLPVFLLFFLTSFSQELPPITNFSPQEYAAGNQNWMLSQGDDKRIYIANNSGLLEYNGERWNLHHVPGEAAVRSVLALKDKVYTGSYMDFGYWKSNDFGELEYTSLGSSIDDKIMDGEQFWHILHLGDYIYFQSLRRLLRYNTETGKATVVARESKISNIFKVEGKIYFQVAEKGLFLLGREEAFVSNSLIQNKPIVGLFSYSEEEILAVTRDDGVYLIGENGEWEPLRVNDYPFSESIFSSLYLSDGTLVLGSIGSGLYVLNIDKGKQYHLSQPAIVNNTVLSVMRDDSGNIWGGLDSGLTLVNQQSPFRLFTDIYGDIGTVYCSYSFGNLLYLGTNQGLYARRAGSAEPYALVKGTSGQVWSIGAVQGKLLVGHDRGTFLIDDFSSQLLFDSSGTWEVKKLGDGILEGHYNGISYSDNFSPATATKYIKGFDLSSRNLVVQNDSVIWVGHDHKGVYRLLLNNDYSAVKTVKHYAVSYKGKWGLKIFSFQDSIYFSTQKEIYKYLPEKDSFTEENVLNKITADQERISGISQVLADDTWWTFGRDKLIFVKKDPFEDKLLSRSVFLPLAYRSIAEGFENISLVGEQTYLVGSNAGYTVFELPVQENAVAELRIDAVEAAGKGENYTQRGLDLERLSLPREINYLDFQYSIPYYGKLGNVGYSYRLLGYAGEWSPWGGEAAVSFKNLPAGDYTFEVRGKYNGVVTKTVSYDFSIARPWYFSTWAIISYIFLFILLLYGVHQLYTGYYRKQRDKLIERNRKKLELEQLESQQEIMRLQNEQLEADVASKNRELAASTMNIIKKNEFLTELKNELAAAKGKEDIDKVVKIINKDIAEKDNWKLFKEAFDNADKDFLQAVKKVHPNLTSNDLKLCAYLRLNLSSKEIAPLLNISVRSVEIKRYRLRKKMDLDHDKGLVEYILTF